MPPGIPSPPGSAGGDAAGRGGLLPAEATTAERSALVQEPKSDLRPLQILPPQVSAGEDAAPIPSSPGSAGGELSRSD